MANCSSTSTYAYILVQVSDGRQALSIPHTKDRKGQQDSSESASDNQDLLLLQDAEHFAREMIHCSQCHGWFHLDLCVATRTSRQAKWFCSTCI